MFLLASISYQMWFRGGLTATACDVAHFHLLQFQFGTRFVENFFAVSDGFSSVVTCAEHFTMLLSYF